MRWSILSLVLVVGIAYSQQHGQDKKQPAKGQQTGTEKKPFVVKVQPAPKTQTEAKQEKDEREAKAKSEALKKKTDEDLVRFTEKLADYTWLLFCVGFGQVVIFVAQLVFIWRQETTTKNIERAYVKMSHTEAGLRAVAIIGPLVVDIKVENFGKTPAEITDVVVDLRPFDAGQPLPAVPEYRRLGMTATHTVLVVGDFFNLHLQFAGGMKEGPFKMSELADALDGKKILYLLGYVDYIDKFGRRHRAGYARRYDHAMPANSNNLVFVTQRGYNYDRKRKKGEGNDWDKKITS